MSEEFCNRSADFLRLKLSEVSSLPSTEHSAWHGAVAGCLSQCLSVFIASGSYHQMGPPAAKARRRAEINSRIQEKGRSEVGLLMISSFSLIFWGRAKGKVHQILPLTQSHLTPSQAPPSLRPCQALPQKRFLHHPTLEAENDPTTPHPTQAQDPGLSPASSPQGSARSSCLPGLQPPGNQPSLPATLTWFWF